MYEAQKTFAPELLQGTLEKLICSTDGAYGYVTVTHQHDNERVVQSFYIVDYGSDFDVKMTFIPSVSYLGPEGWNKTVSAICLQDFSKNASTLLLHDIDRRLHLEAMEEFIRTLYHKEGAIALRRFDI